MSRTAALILVLFCAACAASPAADQPAPRPAEWAVPVELAGVPNLHRITPGIYRSAQPSAAGMRNLEALGVHHIINLRALHSDRDEVAGTALFDDELSVKAWHMEDEDMIRVLRIIRDPTGGPYLFHCAQGADRTGCVCAMYRMVVQGWTREAAIREMQDGGYGFHAIWANIPRYLARVDIARIRAAVLAPAAGSTTASVPAPAPAAATAAAP